MANISFIIPTFNNYDKIRRCLISIFNNAKLSIGNFEIIVVDDGSKIKNFNKLKNFILGVKKKNIYLIRNNKNRGPAFVRNLGAKKAKFKYLFFLDSDTEIAKKTIFYFLKRIKKCDAVVGIYNYKSINNGVFPNHKALFNNFYFAKSGVKKYETFHSACAGIKKNIFFKVGGFNTKIKWGMDYENEELGRRIIRKHLMILEPDMQVYHNFPNALQMTKLYFRRVKSWVYHFFEDKKFESAGPATLQMALGSLISSSLFFIFIIYLMKDNQLVEKLFKINFVIYVLFYIDFFYFVLKKKLFYLPFCFLINIYINLVITVSAFFAFFNRILFFPFLNFSKFKT